MSEVISERWEFSREDGQDNNLVGLRIGMMMGDLGGDLGVAGLGGELEEMQASLDSVYQRPEDPELLHSLYTPPLSHSVVPETEFEADTFEIRVDDIKVRYVESFSSVMMTIEGELDELVVAALVKDLREKLTKLEKVNYTAISRG